MDAFSYLSVLLSIILGLGLTQVLTAVGRLIRNRGSVRFYWPPLVWAGLLLVIFVQVWWSSFGLRARGTWTFAEFFVVLLQTVALYLVAALALPEEVDAGGVDLRAHYYRQAPWFFGAFALTLLISLGKDLLLEGRLPERFNLWFHLVMLAVSVGAALVRRPWYHHLVALASAAGLAAYVVTLFSTLR